MNVFEGMPICLTVMKWLGPIAVARKGPKLASYCHPLPVSAPVGSVVFADGSAVENSKTAAARGEAIRNATANIAQGNIRRSTADMGVVIRKDRSVWIVRRPNTADFLPKVMKTKNRRRLALFIGSPVGGDVATRLRQPFSFGSLLR